ncbi:glycosyltransferase [Pedobacter caeni]|uniref:Glycosyltransferase involved in cell wall bisynthesis n=1 Tax=Pedobacter caeni TaxID=288992 RepID=A0A1M5D293_9SPHI|nr:glycosyltransferase [Pedobacter caeni]SHF60957.1 Glycosyltransferase involved in cell wall bisynthesis [Pedobacter caeni]
MNIKQSINKRLDPLLKICGLKRIKKDKIDPIILNLYNTNYDKTVLVSYITAPFRDSNHFKHQNYITSHIVAESFSEIGYNVDVVNFNERQLFLDYTKYAVIFGFGFNFEQSFYIQDRNIPRIHFVTGAHGEFHNRMALKSLNDFREISGLWGITESNISTEISFMGNFDADSAIILAHGHVFNDYKFRFSKKLYSLNNNIIGTFSQFESKKTRNSNFLFLSGGYLITKGLALLLEVAKIRKDLNFYIIIPHLSEQFGAYYQDILRESDHVFLYQNLRMDSSEMKEIIERCSYSVAPSYVDGLPGGTIEPMSSGLVPIVSKYCGFESKDFIFEIEDLSVEGLNSTINKAMQLDDTTYFEYSAAVKMYTNEHFSAPGVKSELKKILTLELVK